MLENYDIGRCIGVGGFAHVFQAYDRVRQSQVAIKRVWKASEDVVRRTRNEIEIHQNLCNPYIVKLVDWFEDQENFYVILELGEISLYQYLQNVGKLEEDRALHILWQLICAVSYLHKREVIHRDLKLSNILIFRDFDIKICDFGLAVKVSHPDHDDLTLCGTPYYMAPEITSNRGYGFPADIWSIGIIFYSVLVGISSSKEIDFTLLPLFSSDIRDFLQGVLIEVI
jgi:serine/threonine protein kinase